MQEIIVEKPYKFIPPHRGNWVPSLIQRVRLVDHYLNYFEGVASHEVRGAELLKKSLQKQQGIILAPNHCRYADPLTLGWIAREAKCHVYAMASWHLFQHPVQSFAMQICGGFSVYREGMDRTSIDTAINFITRGERPLVIFPEGTVFRTNDRLNPLLDGVSFLGRSAARRRRKAGQEGVVIHPVAIKYLYLGDLAKTCEPVLKSLEERLTWTEPQATRNLMDRIGRIGEGLLSLKEIQYLGAAQTGSLADRKEVLIERLLIPHETALLGRAQTGKLLSRIKTLRTKLVPQLTESAISEQNRGEIWNRLADLYVAQQIESYPVGYLDEPTNTRVLETIERFDEDVNDQARIHRPWHAILEVGEPIEVSPDKPPKGAPDPVMSQLENSLKCMLGRLAQEAEPV